jgi:hypothetical protein
MPDQYENGGHAANPVQKRVSMPLGYRGKRTRAVAGLSRDAGRV